MIGILLIACADPDYAVLPVLEAVVDMIEAEGASVRMIDGRLCGSLEMCDAPEAIEPVLRELADRRGAAVVLPDPAE